MTFPAPGHPGRDRAQDQVRPGQAGHRDPAPRRGGSPPSRCGPTRRPARPIIAGMGELHLEVLVDRMRREFKVEANVGKPQVAYRETIIQAGVEKRRVHAQEADRWLRPVRVIINLEPTGGEATAALRVREQGHRRSHPARVHPVGGSHRRQDAMQYRRSGRLPAGDVKVTLLDGAYHDVDSSEWRSRSPVDGDEGRPPASGSAPCCSSPSWPSRSRRPRTSSAT